jgi:hypothetical protein
MKTILVVDVNNDLTVSVYEDGSWWSSPKASAMDVIHDIAVEMERLQKRARELSELARRIIDHEKTAR